MAIAIGSVVVAAVELPGIQLGHNQRIKEIEDPRTVSEKEVGQRK
jgi:hypothetical protein